MHRRQRHFKGSAVSCNLQLDARYLTNADGTTLSSWTDRSTYGYSAAQGSGTLMPLVRTGANGINGNAAVSFDGTNDFMSIPSFTINSDMYCLMAVKLTDQEMYLEQSTNANFGNAFYVYGLANRAFNVVRSPGGTFYEFGTNNWVGTSSVIVTLRYSDSGGGGYYKNGVKLTPSEADSLTSGSNATDTLYIMSRAGSSLFSGGLVGSVILGSGDLSESMRKRLQHNLALSFKIACS